MTDLNVDENFDQWRVFELRDVTEEESPAATRLAEICEALGGPADATHAEVLAQIEAVRLSRVPRVWLPGDTVPAGVTTVEESGDIHTWRGSPPRTRAELVEVFVPDFAAAVAAEQARRTGGAA